MYSLLGCNLSTFYAFYLPPGIRQVLLYYVLVIAAVCFVCIRRIVSMVVVIILVVVLSSCRHLHMRMGSRHSCVTLHYVSEKNKL